MVAFYKRIQIMKVKLIEYPFGKVLNINQDVVWFIQTVEGDNKAHTVMWDELNGRVVYIMDKHAPSLQMAAYTNSLDANIAFNKIRKWFIEQSKQHQIKVLREVEIEMVKNVSNQEN